MVLQFDPSSPNILNLFYVGDEALFKLRRPFWTELQSRFGNMFYVREQVGPAGRCRGAAQGRCMVPICFSQACEAQISDVKRVCAHMSGAAAAASAGIVCRLHMCPAA